MKNSSAAATPAAPPQSKNPKKSSSEAGGCAGVGCFPSRTAPDRLLGELPHRRAASAPYLHGSRRQHPTPAPARLPRIKRSQRDEEGVVASRDADSRGLKKG